MDDDKSFHDEPNEQGRLRFRHKFLEQSPSRTPKFNQKRVSNPKSQEDGSEILLLGCSKCDKRHEGECLAGSNISFGCGELGQKIRNCPKVARNEEDTRRRSQHCPSSGPICLGILHVLGQNVQVRLPGTTLMVPKEDPNPWPNKLPCQLEVAHGGSMSPSQTSSTKGQNIGPPRTCFPTKSAKIKLKFDLFKRHSWMITNPWPNKLPSQLEVAYGGSMSP
ncbi:hypothetical protein MTR67_043756 [Solanum verrucosum]|uniref:Uncharacterized protein n=1 Tax=Solanum verrucosum TaxID=315347 RepID=A0AAF0ZSZ3_SOLVR|nr:hypothetical protein MTR67_043756 [Solanum verrucosum]